MEYSLTIIKKINIVKNCPALQRSNLLCRFITIVNKTFYVLQGVRKIFRPNQRQGKFSEYHERTTAGLLCTTLMRTLVQFLRGTIGN